MHELAPLIKDLAIILGIASITALIFQKIRQPIVLGYLLAGVIIGPYTPPHALVSDIPDIKILSELGVIFLMFSLGLDFSFHKIKQVGLPAGISGIIEVFGMVLIGFLTGTVLGWPIDDSLFLGAALAISSTTIIIKALEELRVKTKPFAQITFGILIIEDLLAIILLAALSTFAITHTFFHLSILWALLKFIIVVGGWFIIGYFCVPTFLRNIMHFTNQEILTILSVALCLILVTIASYFNYSTALGAFIMGSILAETPLIHHIENLIKPLRDVFAAVFFVSIGMLIDPHTLTHQYGYIIIITLVTIIGKVLTTGLGTFLSGQNYDTSIRTGFAMGQIGEFSFIIAGLGLTLNIIEPSFYSLIVAVSAVTTFTTPYMIQFSNKLCLYLDKKLSSETKQKLNQYSGKTKQLFGKENKSIYTSFILRLFLNALMIAVIFNLVEYGMMKYGSAWIASVWLYKLIGWITATAFSSPFIFGMLTSYKLIAETKKNKKYGALAIILFSSICCLIEVTILSIVYFDGWLTTSLLALFCLLIFILLYRRMEYFYSHIENHFRKNFSSHLRKKK